MASLTSRPPVGSHFKHRAKVSTGPLKPLKGKHSIPHEGWNPAPKACIAPSSPLPDPCLAQPSDRHPNAPPHHQEGVPVDCDQEWRGQGTRDVRAPHGVPAVIRRLVVRDTA